MSVSNRPSAYGPILRAILNKAVQSTSGIALEVKDESEGIQTRQRLYKVRDLENKNLQKSMGDAYAGPWDPIRILLEHKDFVGEGGLLKRRWFVILTKDEILLGQANVTDLATGERLGVAGDLLRGTEGSPGTAAEEGKDPFS